MPEFSFFPASSNVRSSPPHGPATAPTVTLSPDFWCDDFRIKRESEELKTEKGLQHEQPLPLPLLGR